MVVRGLVWTGIGLAATPLVEYAWHAWIAHSKNTSRSPLFATREQHLEHHRSAAEPPRPWREIGDNLPTLGALCAGLNLTLGPFIGLSRTLPLSLGLLSGYALTTLYHAQMHERPPRNAYERWMWRFHWHHHARDARVNFGLTNPLLDFVFRTAHVPAAVTVPVKLAPAWLRAAPAAGITIRSAP